MLWSYKNKGNSRTSPVEGLIMRYLKKIKKHAQNKKNIMTTENDAIFFLLKMMDFGIKCLQYP